MYQLGQIELREREVLRADHDRHEEVAERRRNRRDQEEEHHHDAVHREQLVVGVVGDEIAGRRREIEPDEHGEGAADEEEERDRRQVQERDALVIARQQPRLHAVSVVQIVARLERGRCWTWFYYFFFTDGVFSPGRRGRLRARGRHFGLRLERLHVFDQLEQLLFADEALKRRHDRLVAGGDLRASACRIDSRT